MELLFAFFILLFSFFSPATKRELSLIPEEPLHKAVRRGDIIEVKNLIKKGADVHAKDRFEDTPLHIASKRKSNVEMAKLLIEKGANVYAKDNKGVTSLDYARKTGNLDEMPSRVMIRFYMLKHWFLRLVRMDINRKNY